MSENMFEIRNKESRRKQFIEENLDVADEIINTNPNVTMFKNEENIKEPENVDTSEIDNEETDKNEKTEFNFSLYKKEKIRKKSYSYYLEEAIDELVILIEQKTDMSKSEFINLILKSALSSNEGVQELAKTDDKVQNILEKLKK